MKWCWLKITFIYFTEQLDLATSFNHILIVLLVVVWHQMTLWVVHDENMYFVIMGITWETTQQRHYELKNVYILWLYVWMKKKTLTSRCPFEIITEERQTWTSINCGTHILKRERIIGYTLGCYRDGWQAA